MPSAAASRSDNADMRYLLIGVVLITSTAWAGQAPAPAAPAPAAPRPTQTAPARPAPRPAAAAARAGMAITVTNPAGATIPGVRVEVLGASDRSGETNASGQINFT